MFKVVFLFAISSAAGFDPWTYDYCSYKCLGKPDAVHSACKCGVRKPRQEITTDIKKFRQDALDAHNKFRNKIASGGEAAEYAHLPAASDMTALNYDMELEYIARCYAVNSFENAHDQCRIRHGDRKGVGQNVAAQTYDMTNITHIVLRWYNEIENIEADRVDAYKRCKVGCGHFTQVVWSRADALGCARVNHTGKKLNYVLICNYGSSFGSNGGNMNTEPVYKKGSPCSECAQGLKCENAEYPALCGKILPVPEELRQMPVDDSAGPDESPNKPDKGPSGPSDGSTGAPGETGASEKIKPPGVFVIGFVGLILTF